MKKPFFNGMSQPSTDFESVRDGRRSTLFYYDVNLTNARSIAAGTMLILNLAGNSFYVDQDTNTVGYATVHFQDTNLGISPAPIFVSPGFIANVPFTQLLIENTAQPGKRLRIFYGVDIDFQAGVIAQISITGAISAALTVASILPHAEYTNNYVSVTNKAANTADVIFAPGSNINGAILWEAVFVSEWGGPNFGGAGMLAKASAPTTIIDGDVILGGTPSPTRNTNDGMNGRLIHPVKIAAGKGLYFIATPAEANAYRSALYTLL